MILVSLLVTQPVLSIPPEPAYGGPHTATTSPTAARNHVRQGSLNTDPFGLAIGDTVKVIATSLNCRATPSPNGTLISTEASGQLGTIDNGSVSSGGYIWWYIAYTDGNTGWSAEGTGSTAWLQNVTGQNTSSVAYNRTAAMYYAAHYWNVVTSDGYFWNSSSTYISLAQGTNVTGMSGDDCAHFVSQVIGDEPHQPGGGLNIPSRVPPTYGEPGNAALGDMIINNGWGVVVPSVSNLLPGDVINYQWLSTDPTWDHIAVYLGNGTVAAHTNSHYGANWTLGGAYAYRFIHILNGSVGGSMSVSSFAASPATVQTGATTYLNTTVSGGTQPLTFAYTGLPTGCASANSASLACTPTAAGKFNVTVTVSDSSGLTASKTTLLTVLIYSPPTTILQSVSLSPPTSTLSVGGSVVLTASPTCSPGACPSNIVYTWNVAPNLGSFTPTSGAVVTFQAGSTSGSASITVNATLNTSTKTSSPTVVTISSTPAPAVLTSAAVSPTSPTVPVNGSVTLNASAVCSPRQCLPTLSYQWTLANPVLGTLSSTAGPSVSFGAGATPGTTQVSVTAIYNGTSKSANATVTIQGTSGGINTLVSVRISPANLSVAEGGKVVFSGMATCSLSSCPAKVVYTWSLNNTLGTLSASIGQNTSFVAGSAPGDVLVTLTASWDGKTVTSQTHVTVNAAQTTPPSSTVLGMSSTTGIGLLIVAGLIGVAAIAVAVRRKRRSPPSPENEGVSTDQ